VTCTIETFSLQEGTSLIDQFKIKISDWFIQRKTLSTDRCEWAIASNGRNEPFLFFTTLL